MIIARDHENWVSVLHNVVGSYNRIVHTATNQIPMKLFMRFTGVHPSFSEEEARLHERSFLNENGEIEYEESSNEDEDLINNVYDHRSRYIERMLRPNINQINSLDFSVGDRVLVL